MSYLFYDFVAINVSNSFFASSYDYLYDKK